MGIYMLFPLSTKPKSNRNEFPLWQVFDYDWGLQDDFMGSAKLDLTQLELGKAEDIHLQLCDSGGSPGEHGMGEILINLTLWPRSQEDKEMVSGVSLESINPFTLCHKRKHLVWAHQSALLYGGFSNPLSGHS